MGQGSTFKRRLRDASVVDLFFYLMLLVCVVFQTWGYSFTDRAYMGSVALMDIFVLPSLYEGLGLVAIEAQSAGLPTICSMGVAEDANVSPLFQRVSLDDGPAAWVSTIVDNAGVRESALGPEGVKAHGFDVRDSSLKMQEWYLKEAADAR